MRALSLSGSICSTGGAGISARIDTPGFAASFLGDSFGVLIV